MLNNTKNSCKKIWIVFLHVVYLCNRNQTLKAMETMEMKSDASRGSARFLTDEDYINTKNIDNDLIGVWSIFRISGGRKFFISSLYKEDLKWNETRLKYSDELTLKLTKDYATRVALINKERYVTRIGITNNKGVQIIL